MSKSQRLREQGLEDLVAQFIDQARNLGYQAEEVEKTFIKIIMNWKEEDQDPNTNKPARGLLTITSPIKHQS